VNDDVDVERRTHLGRSRICDQKLDRRAAEKDDLLAEISKLLSDALEPFQVA
jgi:hypothetical protein